MAPVSGFIIFCLVITGAYLAGLLMFINDHERNRCDMTFMFEYPQFVRIYSKRDDFYKKYALYAYSEGRFTYRARQMDFDGIPVLFIPGNAGSYKQIRSFASVALRKGLDAQPGFHFDFFTIDLNDEFSGLNGALLDEQTQYVNSSISRVLQLYRERKRSPRSIILIGHSMGGIIARGLLSSLPENSNVLPLVITLATPHVRPAIALDSYVTEYYRNVQKGNMPSKSTVIGLSGGYNDFLVSPFITFAKDFPNFHVVTTAVPLVWLPVDHLCILWCKQLILAVTRALFDVVDPATKQISSNPEHVRRVFHHYLVHHSGTKVNKVQQYRLPASFGQSTNKWIENLQTQYTVSLPSGTKQSQWHMIRLIDQPSHEFLTILAVNLEVTDWVFACPAEHVQGETRVCWDGIHLSHLSEIAPSVRSKRRTLRLNLHDLKKNFTQSTHVVVRVLPTSKPVALHMDIFNYAERRIEVSLPRWWSLQRQQTIEETADKTINYELVLPQLQHVIQFYQLHVNPVRCSNNVHHATASLQVPWAHHDIHQYFTESERSPLDVRLHNSRPQGLNNSFATIRLTLDPVCTYSISIQNSFMGMLGQLARIYSPMLIANAVAVILLGFRNQLTSINKTGSCLVFFNAMKHGVKPYYILTMVKLASRGLSWKGFANILPPPDWQQIADEGNDFFLLPLLLYKCSVGLVWLTALGLALSLIFCESTFHKLASKFLARTVTGALKFSDWLIGGLHKLPCIVATVLVSLSISTCGSLAMCLGCAFYFLKLTQMSQDYVEGLTIRVVKYFARKLKKRVLSQQTSQDNSGLTESDLRDRALSRVEDEVNKGDEQNEVIESNEDIRNEVGDENKEEDDSSNVVMKEDEPAVARSKNELVPKESECNENENNSTGRQEPAEHSSIFFHFSIFLLWGIVTVINLPSVLTWAHNFKYSTALEPDPSFLPGITLSVCAIPLWHLDLPRADVTMYSLLGHVFNILAAISLLYAPISIYRLNYIIVLAIVLISLHQVLAPVKTEVLNETPEEGESEPADPSESFDQVKAKWE